MRTVPGSCITTTFALTAAIALSAAHAQDASTGPGQGWPVKPIRLVVPSSPGGGTDAAARVVAPRLSERLGRQVVLEYRPGAAAMIGTEAVARAAPDGYTLLIGQSTMTIVPSVYRKVGFDPIRDFSPVSIVAVVPLLLVGHPSLPAKNVKELVALARARPDDIDYVAGAYGGNSHLAMEHLLATARVRMRFVPYKSGNAGLVDALAGRVPVMLSNVLVSLPHVRNGRFRAFGVSSSSRAAEVPEIPTIAEAGVPGYEAVQWFGILAPTRTASDIVARLHREVAHVMQEEETRKRFIADGANPAFSRSPDEFGAFMRSELAKWANVVQHAKLEKQ